ncbi:MAG: type II toxin-antitoxin system VapC family toxin [Pseudomonadota bacterium]
MILLDTNVISELLRPAPEPRVEAWLAAQDGAGVFLSAVSAAELRFGAALLPSGRRREALMAALHAIPREDFAGRLLPFDDAAAEAYAEIAAARRAAGRPISAFDAQIAAIARAQGAAVATRNARDFEGCGIEVIDPWMLRP